MIVNTRSCLKCAHSLNYYTRETRVKKKYLYTHVYPFTSYTNTHTYTTAMLTSYTANWHHARALTASSQQPIRRSNVIIDQSQCGSCHTRLITHQGTSLSTNERPCRHHGPIVDYPQHRHLRTGTARDRVVGVFLRSVRFMFSFYTIHLVAQIWQTSSLQMRGSMKIP